MSKKILIINGPNLNLLGEREESKYGKVTREEVKKNCETHAKSIGIEIQNSGHMNKYEGFSIKQIKSLLLLTKILKKTYNIKSKNFLGHSDIAPNRKIDPGEKFPWKYLSKYKIGIWYNLPKKDLKLNKELEKLDGKKIIFTNGSKKHALNITQKIGIDHHFDDFFDIIDANFIPKPAIEPYKKIVEKHKIDPKLCAFVEDIARNLKPAYEMGMTTVWIENDEPWAAKFSDSNFINYKTKNLTEFLKKINLLKAA